MHYIVIKHDGNLRTQGKCRKHESQANVFNVSRVFSNVWSVLSQCDTQLRLLHFALTHKFYARKTIKQAISKTWVFDQWERAQGPLYIIDMIHCVSKQSSFSKWSQLFEKDWAVVVLTRRRILHGSPCTSLESNRHSRPFTRSGHVVQNHTCWDASSKAKQLVPVHLDLPLN